MNTGEMINKIFENKDKTFKNSFYKVNFNKYGILVVNGGPNFTIDVETECYEWEEVKQPYTFLEAYEDCKKTKIRYINPKLKLRIYNCGGVIRIEELEKHYDDFILGGVWEKED